VPDFVADLQGVRVAAEYVRAMLRKWPALRQQLRELLWKVDSGEAVDIAGLPDAQLRSALRACFDYLNLHITSQVQGLRVGGEGSEVGFGGLDIQGQAAQET